MGTEQRDINAARVWCVDGGMMPGGVKLAGRKEITIDDTADGKTLETLLTAAGGGALPDNLKYLVLTPETSGAWMSYDENATAGVGVLPAGEKGMSVDKTEADKLKLIANSGETVPCVVEWYV